MLSMISVCVCGLSTSSSTQTVNYRAGATYAIHVSAEQQCGFYTIAIAEESEENCYENAGHQELSMTHTHARTGRQKHFLLLQ